MVFFYIMLYLIKTKFQLHQTCSHSQSIVQKSIKKKSFASLFALFPVYSNNESFMLMYFNTSYATQTCCDLNECCRRLLCVWYGTSLCHSMLFNNTIRTTPITPYLYTYYTKKKEKLIRSQQKPFMIEIILLCLLMFKSQKKAFKLHIHTRPIYIYI